MEITFEQIKDVIVDTLGCDPDDVKPETRLVEDLDADSLELVDLSMTMQEALGVGIADEDLEAIHTVEDVLNYIRSHKE